MEEDDHSYRAASPLEHDAYHSPLSPHHEECPDEWRNVLDCLFNGGSAGGVSGGGNAVVPFVQSVEKDINHASSSRHSSVSSLIIDEIHRELLGHGDIINDSQHSHAQNNTHREQHNQYQNQVQNTSSNTTSSGRDTCRIDAGEVIGSRDAENKFFYSPTMHAMFAPTVTQQQSINNNTNTISHSTGLRVFSVTAAQQANITSDYCFRHCTFDCAICEGNRTVELTRNEHHIEIKHELPRYTHFPSYTPHFNNEVNTSSSTSSSTLFTSSPIVRSGGGVKRGLQGDFKQEQI
eukprot:gene37831-46679_t